MTFVALAAYGLVLCAVLCGIFVKYGTRWGLVSRRDFRRKNASPIPLLGGLALFITISSVSLLVKDRLPITWPIVLASLPLFLVGFIDDRFEISARFKFASQFLAAGIFLWLWPAEDLLLNRLGWFPPLAYAVMAFWTIGIINAMNMIDGMDGEAGVISLMALIAIFGLTPDIEGPLLAVSGGAVAGFLLFNRPPARIYLGESGSAFLGFFIAAHLLQYAPPDGLVRTTDLLVPLFILAIPEIDAVLAIGRRLHLGSSIFAGDNDHLHHKLLRLGMSVPSALSTITTIGAYCAAVGLVISRLDHLEYRLLLVLASAIVLLLVTRLIFFFEKRQAILMSAYGRTMIEQSLAMREVSRFDESDFRATVYDLLPYYKELQQSGILAVQSFTRDFAHFIETFHSEESGRQMIGSYSLVVIESPRKMTLQSESQIAQEFFLILARHGLQKNTGERPWGLDFHTDQYKSQAFLKSFRSSKYRESEIQLKKPA